jgi:hypothetical protein
MVPESRGLEIQNRPARLPEPGISQQKYRVLISHSEFSFDRRD